MKAFDIDNFVRPHLKNLEPYSTARDEFEGQADIFLDANENPFDNGMNRYPDPHQKELKQSISKLKGVPPENILLGNGSDETIDLPIRAFCRPGQDKILIFPPTYGMYKVAAQMNDVGIIHLPLNHYFKIEIDQALPLLSSSDLRMIFICSPNNPSGVAENSDTIRTIVQQFNGLVVVDEAYIDFCPENSMVSELSNYPNMMILQTFSKAWGLAGIRLGMMFAHTDIINLLNKIKYPYNISCLTLEAAQKAIHKSQKKDAVVRFLLEQRTLLKTELKELSIVTEVIPSDANFLLVKFKNAQRIFNYLLDKSIIIRNRCAVIDQSIRITIGTEKENRQLIDILKSFE